MAGFSGRTADIKITPSTTEHILEHCHEIDTYTVTSPRGRLLLINNQKFDTPVHPDQKCLNSRAGSEIDCDNLEELFKQLDFIVNVQENVSSKSMMKLLEKETRLEEQRQYGMFSLIILSHGDESCVYGRDDCPVYFKDIYELLSGRSFRAMKGKPKLLIFQACSGSKYEKSPPTVDSCPGEDEDEEFKEASAVSGSLATRPQSPQISPNSDFFILRSSFPGFVSLLDGSKGSLLVQAFVEVMQQFACREEIGLITTKIRSTVHKMCEEDKKMFEKYGHQTIFNIPSLTKSLYFFPGYDSTKPVEPAAAKPVEPAAAKPVEPATTPLQRVTTKLTSSVSNNKLTFLEHIKTPGWCFTVCHLSDGSLLHGGNMYGLVGFAEKLDISGIIRCMYLDELTNKLFVSVLGNGLSKSKSIVSVLGNVLSKSQSIYEIDLNTLHYHCVIKYSSDRLVKQRHLAVNKNYIVALEAKITMTGGGIKVFLKDGDYRHLYDIKLGEFYSPWGIEFLNEDSIVVSDKGNNLVLNVKLSEKPEIIWRLTESDGINSPTGVHIDRRREIIFVSDYHGNDIYMISYTGQLLKTLKVPDGVGPVEDVSVYGDELILANGYFQGIRKLQLSSCMEVTTRFMKYF